MTSSSDPERLIRSFLDEGATELPDRVYDAVRSDLDRTRQRVVIGPWRAPNMNTFAKFAMAAAAVLVVAIVGYNVLPPVDEGGGTTPTVSPSPSPSASVSPPPSTTPSLRPAPSQIDGAIPPAGMLEVGRHSFSQNGVGFSLEVSAGGWISSGLEVPPDGGHLLKGTRGFGGAAWILFWSIDGVYSDPCGHVAAPPVSPSAADLATAVATLPGANLVSGPTDVTVGGRAARHVAITIPEDITCAPEQFYLWYDDVRCDTTDPCHRWASALGETNSVWIFEVDGKHVWIEAETYAGATPEIQQEVQAIIDSIQFE